jgi:hypothetical protein
VQRNRVRLKKTLKFGTFFLFISDTDSTTVPNKIPMTSPHVLVMEMHLSK